MSKYLQFSLDEWDRRSEIGLMNSPVGSGKTYNSIYVLPDLLGVDRNKTLLLSPRDSIRKQTLKQYPDKTEDLTYHSAFGSNSKIQVSTVQAIGRWFKTNKKFMDSDLIVIDEFHTLFSEHIFAADLLYFQQILLEWMKDPNKIVVACTATTTLPIKFINSCLFRSLEWIYDNFSLFKLRSIVKDQDPVYRIGEVQIEQGKSLETVLRELPANYKNKQLVFTKGRIDRLRDLAAMDPSYSWLCSSKSSSRIDETRACELMNQDHYKSLISGYLPDQINRIYLSSAYREGLNVFDPDVREVIIEGVTDIDIIQSLGRVRHDLDRVVIVIDKRKYSGIDKKVSHAIELLRSGDLRSYFEIQEKQETEENIKNKVPILVYRDLRTNDLRFNFFALCYWLYEQYSICSARQARNEETIFLGKKLPSGSEYFEGMIGRYCGNISFNKIEYDRSKSFEEKNNFKIKEMDWSAWSGMEVWGSKTNDFSLSLGLENTDSTLMKISGIYRNYPELFDFKKSLRRDGKRRTVYKIASVQKILEKFY